MGGYASSSLLRVAISEVCEDVCVCVCCNIILSAKKIGNDGRWEGWKGVGGKLEGYLRKISIKDSDEESAS